MLKLNSHKFNSFLLYFFLMLDEISSSIDRATNFPTIHFLGSKILCMYLSKVLDTLLLFHTVLLIVINNNIVMFRS